MSRSCWCAQAGHQCLCVLSTWLVVCLVPCAPMSIVCPLPSCYLIIVSVAPAVSPSLPSFVSLYSLLVSAVLFWSVVFRVSMSCELNVWLCSSLLPACLFFPFGVVFVLLFNFVIKTLNSSAFESSTSSLVTIVRLIDMNFLFIELLYKSNIIPVEIYQDKFDMSRDSLTVSCLSNTA